MEQLNPPPLLPDIVLAAYAQGFFPMADTLDPLAVTWYNPPQRAILPIETIHIPRRLQDRLRKNPFEIRIDTAFAAVIDGCAERTEKRPVTWINDDIKQIFLSLHQAGYAHSVECWQGDSLVGGLYGMALGSAFCGESMFSRVTNASQIALVHLCARLSTAGFDLLDCQIINDHTARFGAYEIPKADYLHRLGLALPKRRDFSLAGQDLTESALLQGFLKKNLTIS